MDANPQEQPYQSPEQTEEKKGRGCFFWGCLTMLVLTVVVVVGGGFGTYWVLNKQIQTYTDETPAEIPVVEANEQELAELKGKVETMQDAIEAGEPAGELVLTAEEINKLISANDDLRGKVYITLQDDQVKADISIPTDFLPIGKGRFFNASATLDVSFEDRVLMIRLVDAEVKGQRLPQQLIDAIAQENLAKEIYSDADKAEVLRKFESIQIRDGKVILKAKSDDQAAEAGTEVGELPVAQDDTQPPAEDPVPTAEPVGTGE